MIIEHCSTPDCPACNLAAYEQGKKDECLAWLEDRRCYRCGTEKEPDLASQCDSCYDNE